MRLTQTIVLLLWLMAQVVFGQNEALNPNSPSGLFWRTTGNSNTNSGTNFIGTTNSVSLRFRTNNTERMVIDSTGKVGIGIANPADAVLQVNSTAWRKINFSGTGTAAMGRLGLDGAGSTFSTNAYWGGTSWVRDDVAEPSFALIEHTGNSRYEFRVATPNTGNIVWTTAMVVNTAANVGIGTTAPTQRLHIVGSVRIVDGTQANNYILKSDANGNASWADISTLISTNDWSTTGNSGTVDGTNFIGTTDNIPFTVRVNNQTAGKINHLLNNASWGYNTLRANTTGYDNTAIGDSAMFNNTTGYGNSALGHIALRNNTTGYGNNATGYQTLYRNTTGYYNVADGFQALNSNTSGHDNVALGYRALYSNTSQDYMVAIGYDALTANTGGASNTAVGASALATNTSGYANVAMGNNALRDNDDGYSNTAVGYNALRSNEGGYSLTAIGRDAGINGAAFNLFSTAVGANAQVSAAGCLVLGAISGVNGHTFGNTKVGIGTTAPAFPLDVVGLAIQGNIFHRYLNSGGVGTTTSTIDVSIRANEAILAAQFSAVSDERIKRSLGQTNSAQDLAIINRLRVTDYTYRDSIRYATQKMRGFLAQELELQMPEAVSTITNFIPDIYALSEAVIPGHSQNSLVIKLPVKHNLIVNDRVNIITKAKHIVMVDNIIDDYTFEICDYYEPFTEKVFVFGREVNDFRVVDYNRVFVTGISAIQELSVLLENERKINLEQSKILHEKANLSEINVLRSGIEELKQLILKSSIQSIK